jgi:urate oxidase
MRRTGKYASRFVFVRAAGHDSEKKKGVTQSKSICRFEVTSSVEQILIFKSRLSPYLQDICKTDWDKLFVYPYRK